MEPVHKIKTAIKTRSISTIINYFLNENQEIKSGRKVENDLWDYKLELPPNKKGFKKNWANIAKDVLAFHNTHGGILIIGINDKSFATVGVDYDIDSKTFNDQIRKWTGDSFWVEFHKEFIKHQRRYIGFVIIPPNGPKIKTFISNGPDINKKSIFKKGESAIRNNDESQLLSIEETQRRQNTLDFSTVHKQFIIDEPYFRILNTEYNVFIKRKDICDNLINALFDERCSVVSLIGIGGIGKTAIATWAVLKVYYAKKFDFIVSITAKDRELSVHGITSIIPILTTFENLLDTILEVMGFIDEKKQDIEIKKMLVNTLITDVNGLLFIDNLETIDDERIINFIDNLPKKVKALTTSRRQIIRKYVYPIDIYPFKQEESLMFVKSLSNQQGLSYINSFSDTEINKFTKSCDNIPLAIKWTLRSSNSIREAIVSSDQITNHNKKGEELLEFSFRRIFDKMSDVEQKILKTISVFQKGLMSEAICVGSQLRIDQIEDGLDNLNQDTIVYKVFQEKHNDYCYTILPIIQAFIKSKVLKQQEADNIRIRLTNWYMAKDIKDPQEREQIQKIRQGEDSLSSSHINLGLAALQREDYQSAITHFKNALQRDSKSWKASFHLAETLKKIGNVEEALHCYEQASNFCPQNGPHKAIIYREWGFLYRKAAYPDATRKSIEKIEIALSETPNDEYCLITLASLYVKLGQYSKIPKLLEPLLDHDNSKTREYAQKFLLKAYEQENDIINVAKIKRLMKRKD